MENLRAIALMVLSMAGFAIEDMLIKYIALEMPTGQFLMLIGAGGALIFTLMAWRQGQAVLSADFLRPTIIIRNLGEVIGTLGFVTALVLTPLSSASAILQATPLAVTLGAALFLREAVGWRRWSAILIGFCGVVAVIRPGLEGFQPASLFAVLGVIGLATRDVATRATPATISSLVLSAHGFGMLVPAGAFLLWISGGAVAPSAQGYGLLFAALIIGVSAYYALTLSMRLGDVAVVTPFRYVRLVFALFIGVTVFHEQPDAWTLGGAAIIILSGLYTFFRERQLGLKTRS
ncbi:MAG TPA: EamA family transporter [Rhodobacteraceae bacterium]|mgnify:FL=1|jgi:drug/metabolite transporter (DMT)-like permease|nr:DMT family transporter [Paracoccaceae bacterium]HBR61993.1 EamA family transporter [Paracoccaceae bacterium]|tara:strand:- start:5106 stop:5978 length:873 start_codon:yes stop_codon:yes gene_type:complete